MEKYSLIKNLNNNHDYERTYGPVAFDARAEKSSPEAALAFLEANGFLGHEAGFVFYFFDGPLEKAAEIADVGDFLSRMTKLAWAEEHTQDEAGETLKDFLHLLFWRGYPRL